MIELEPPVYALATAPGGAISILRLSGEGSLDLALRVFVDARMRTIKDLEHGRMHYGYLLDPKSSQMIDEVFCVYFRKGLSYTLEEMVEFHCHGSIAIIEKTMELFSSLGAKAAKPGEFTKRAFLNGRIGLSQAEAIRDLVEAETFLESSAAIHNLKGELKSKVVDLRENLLNCAAHLEVNLDYPEEDIEDLSQKKIELRIEVIRELMEKILISYQRMSVLREGIFVVILGEPNAGKSSLLNSLLKEERAIVTDIPGTTRDHIEESIRYQGVKFRIVDTAGLRESQDPVEKIGIERSREMEEKAQIRVYIYDGTQAVQGLEKRGRCLHVFNKKDLGIHPMNQEFENRNDTRFISALTGDGLDELLSRLSEISQDLIGKSDPEIPSLTSKRQAENLQAAKESLDAFQNSLRTGIPVDICMVELYEAIDQLGEITGSVITEDILDRIFSTFCIGK